MSIQKGITGSSFYTDEGFREEMKGSDVEWYAKLDQRQKGEHHAETSKSKEQYNRVMSISSCKRSENKFNRDLTQYLRADSVNKIAREGSFLFKNWDTMRSDWVS